jgi:hypothetical protein
MNPDQSCKQETLSQHNCFQISKCSCGVLHLSIGPMTIRLSPESIDELSAVVLAARAKLYQEALTVGPLC